MVPRELFIALTTMQLNESCQPTPGGALCVFLAGFSPARLITAVSDEFKRNEPKK